MTDDELTWYSLLATGLPDPFSQARRLRPSRPPATVAQRAAELTRSGGYPRATTWAIH